jgi:hypothetical protein
VNRLRILTFAGMLKWLCLAMEVPTDALGMCIDALVVVVAIEVLTAAAGIATAGEEFDVRPVAVGVLVTSS